MGIVHKYQFPPGVSSGLESEVGRLLTFSRDCAILYCIAWCRSYELTIRTLYIDFRRVALSDAVKIARGRVTRIVTGPKAVEGR